MSYDKKKRETESLSITAQNNAIKTSYIQSKINYMQQNRKYWQCEDRDET